MIKQRKIHILGLDGACWSILDYFAGKGIMPHLESLKTQCVHGDLLSTIPPYSAPAWASFMTGKNPGKTGVFSLFKRTHEGKTEPVSGEDIRTSYFWDITGTHGLSSTIVNVPMTYPPRPINGVLVSGLFTPSDSKQFTYPENLSESIFERFPGYHPAPFTNVEQSCDFIDRMIQFTKTGAELEEWLASGTNPHIRIQVVQATDIVQHFFMEYITGTGPGTQRKSIRDRLCEFYSLVDKIIGDRMKILDENGVFIILSDHGFSRLSRVFHMNRWLEDHDYLQRKNRGVARQFLQRIGVTRKNMAALARRLDVFNLIARVGLDKQWELGRKIDSILGGQVDWCHTFAFCGELSEEGIYLNRKSRFGHGILGQDTALNELRHKLKHELHKHLIEIHPDPPLINVFLKEELYHGPEMDNAPDIILDPSPDCLVDAKFSAVNMIEHTDPLAATGRHEKHGMVMMGGPMFRTGRFDKPVSIIDIAPTVLYCLGLGIPESMDGHVPVHLIEQDYLARNPVNTAPDMDFNKQSSSLNEKDKQDIIDRLKGLGYL